MSTPNLDAVTCSSLRNFRNCRKKYFFKHEQGLTPLMESEAQYLGKVIHNCLAIYYAPSDKSRADRIAEIFTTIDAAFPNRELNFIDRKNYNHATAMMAAYVKHYADESFRVIAIEREFSAPLINPETGASSRTYYVRGKVDGIVEIDGENFILEHKTASKIDEAYIERLPLDWQTNLYAHFVQQATGLKITGVVYNVLEKPRIRQSMGETEEKYAERYAELCAKSKNGKSSAKRKLPESDEDYQARIIAEFESGDKFYQRQMWLRADVVDQIVAEVWELGQQLVTARRVGAWYRNTDSCFNYNRQCAYWPICRSNDSSIVIDSDYKIGSKHPEFEED